MSSPTRRSSVTAAKARQPLNFTLAAMRNQHTSSRFGAAHRAVTVAVLLESYGLVSRSLGTADRGHVSRLAVELKGLLPASLFSRAAVPGVSRSSLACSLLRRSRSVSGAVVVCRFWLLRAVAKFAANPALERDAVNGVVFSSTFCAPRPSASR